MKCGVGSAEFGVGKLDHRAPKVTSISDF